MIKSSYVNFSCPTANYFKQSCQFINKVTDYSKKTKVILTETLNPDLFLLFGSIELIITKNGSFLSHLSILGREYGVFIIRIEEKEINFKKIKNIKIIGKDEICFYDK